MSFCRGGGGNDSSRNLKSPFCNARSVARLPTCVFTLDSKHTCRGRAINQEWQESGESSAHAWREVKLDWGRQELDTRGKSQPRWSRKICAYKGFKVRQMCRGIGPSFIVWINPADVTASICSFWEKNSARSGVKKVWKRHSAFHQGSLFKPGMSLFFLPFFLGPHSKFQTWWDKRPRHQAWNSRSKKGGGGGEGELRLEIIFR